jgi:hypothetical protein
VTDGEGSTMCHVLPTLFQRTVFRGDSARPATIGAQALPDWTIRSINSLANSKETLPRGGHLSESASSHLGVLARIAEAHLIGPWHHLPRCLWQYHPRPHLELFLACILSRLLALAVRGTPVAVPRDFCEPKDTVEPTP